MGWALQRLTPHVAEKMGLVAFITKRIRPAAALSRSGGGGCFAATQRKSKSGDETSEVTFNTGPPVCDVGGMGRMEKYCGALKAIH